MEHSDVFQSFSCAMLCKPSACANTDTRQFVDRLQREAEAARRDAAASAEGKQRAEKELARMKVSRTLQLYAFYVRLSTVDIIRGKPQTLNICATT